MRQLFKVGIGILIFLSILTIIQNIFNHTNYGSAILILIAILFNMLFISLATSIILLKKKKIVHLLICIIISAIFIWYIMSLTIKLFFSSYATITGFLFIFAQLDFIGKTIFIASMLMAVIPLSFLMFYLIKSPSKNPKNIINLIIICATAIVILCILIPHDYLAESSPITNSLITLFKSPKSPPEVVSNNTENQVILNINLSEKNQNVIIIMLESLSIENIGFYGSEKNITPNIDWFARNSIVFENAYSSSSQSDYSQTSFLSSRYPLKDKYRDTFKKDYPRRFVWDAFKENGYQTAYISSEDDHWLNMGAYYNVTNLDVYCPSLSDSQFDYGSGQAKNDYDENTTNKIIDWLSNKSKFFLYTDFQATHYYYNYPPGNSYFTPDGLPLLMIYDNILQEDREEMANRYYNALHYVDLQIGRIKQELEKKGILNNTVIIITSDHGESVEKKHEHLMHGFGLYNEDMNVPLIIYIPSQKPEIIYDKVKHIDVVPTLTKILGFRESELFQGSEMKKNKDIFLMTQNQVFKIGIISGDIKYIMDLRELHDEAHNLTADPLEINNLMANPQLKILYEKKYKAMLMRWYNCQINYYDTGYKKNSSISC